MKRTGLIFLLSIFSLSLFSQAHWKKHPGNPVLEPGEAGTWDDKSLFMPSVLDINDTLHMWYAGFNTTGEGGGIGHAFSTDYGLTWTRNPENPVLNTGPEGSWDENHIYFPLVIYDETNSIFHMWYTGGDASIDEKGGYASSTDGIHWTKSASNPLPVRVGTGAILLKDNKFHLWGSYGVEGGITGYFRSDDGITWSEVEDPVMSPESGKWDYPRLQSSSVVYDGNNYHLWYSGGDFMSWQIGYATSTDGIAWTKPELNPVVGIGGAGSWDAQLVGFPSVIHDAENGLYRMWYWGGKEDFSGSIGYAESTEPVGVSKNNFSGQARIYPNPAGDLINIQSDGSGEFSIEITSTNGQLIHSAVMEGTAHQIDLSTFQKGVYFISIRSKDFVTMRKIIKL